jgi:hypothetical protein
MAVTQISRIQHRRGLEQDLPQLSAAELGWSLDTRQLYIGNGTLEEGAPIIGVTRILTEHDVSDITSNTAFASYTFVGNAAGYDAQTGPSSLAPIVRNYQQKFDDVVNIRDFGALGDGTTDDTDAINRALQQIYKSTVSPTEARARRTIVFPGGTYLISNPILIPPYAKLTGDGVSSVIINQSQGNKSVANVCDSLFQTGSNLGSGSAILPQDIEISGITFFNSNSTTSLPIFVIDSASNIKIQSSKFTANTSAGVYANLISIATSTFNTNRITFDNCQLAHGGNGISVIGNGVTSIRVLNSSFDNLSNVAINLNDSENFGSIGNYFGNVGGFTISDGNNVNYSVGDYYYGSNLFRTGLHLGNLQLGTTQQYTLSTSDLVLTPVSDTATVITYEIRNGVNARFGTFSYTKTTSEILYDDSYVETALGVSANMSANSDSILVSVSSGTATFKYSFTTFI